MPTASPTMRTLFGRIDVDVRDRTEAWAGARGETEMDDSAGLTPRNYMYGIGVPVVPAADVTFNAVRWFPANVNRDRDVTFRIWVRSAGYSAVGFGTGTLTPVYQATLPAGSIPPGIAPYTFELGQDIDVLAGECAYFLWSGPVVSEWTAGVFTSQHADGDRPYLHFLHANGNMYPANGSYGADTRYTASPILYQTENITRENVEQYIHSRGEAELPGNVIAGFANATANTIAIYDQLSTTDDVTFDVIDCYAWCDDEDRDIELFVYARPTSAAFAPAQTTALAYKKIAAEDMPKSIGQTSQTARGTFTLDDPVTIPAGYYCFIVFSDTMSGSDGELHVAAWNTASSSPARHAIMYRDTWNYTMVSTSAGTYQAGFRLLLQTPKAIDAETILEIIPSYVPTTNGLTAQDMQQAIDELAMRTTPRVIMPDDVTAVVGDTLQLFLPRGALEAQDPYRYPRLVSCAVGDDLLRYFEYLPVTADVGTDLLQFSVLDLEGNAISTGATVLTTVEATGQPSANKNILIIGDSLAAAGTFPEEVRRRLCDAGGTPTGLSYSNLTFVGTNPCTGDSTQKFVGNSGWTWNDYAGTGAKKAYRLTAATHDKDETDMGSLWQDSAGKSWKLIVAAAGVVKVTAYGDTSATMPAAPGTLTHISGGAHAAAISYSAAAAENATPFWDPVGGALSFAQFATDHGLTSIDAVYFELGWNGISANMYSVVSHAARIALARTLLDQLATDFPSCVTRFLGLQVPSVYGGLGDDYGATGAYSNYFKLLRSVNGYALALQSLCNEADYASTSRYLATALQFDSDYNMPGSAKDVNLRNAASTETIGTNGIHPDTTGYYQIADMLFRDVIRTFCAS